MPKLRRIAGPAAALALLVAPIAQADQPDGPAVPVCNQASPHFQGGGLVATDELVGSPAERYRDDLSELPGRGKGLLNAASHSPALSLCDGGEIIS